jgi:hypothetical protein
MADDGTRCSHTSGEAEELNVRIGILAMEHPFNASSKKEPSWLVLGSSREARALGSCFAIFSICVSAVAMTEHSQMMADTVAFDCEYLVLMPLSDSLSSRTLVPEILQDRGSTVDP